MTEALAVSQALLWVVLVLLVGVVVALARQIGVLHERLAPLGALTTESAVKVGEQAPRLELVDLGGRRLIVGGTHPRGRSTLLVFVSPACPVCKKVLGIAETLARQEWPRLDLVLVGDGRREEQERMLRERGMEGTSCVISPELGLAFRVSKLPYAVLLAPDGVVRAQGLVNSREHLESLLVADETGLASLQEYRRAQAGKEARA